MNKDLVVGNTSQISHYFPTDNNLVKISSRINNNSFEETAKWNNVYLCFGESRKFTNDVTLYQSVNYDLTIKFIKNLYKISNKIIIFATCELWNQYTGQITLELEKKHHETPYLRSKRNIVDFIENNRHTYKNVIIVYPFNFNSCYRKSDFLFGKVYDSIINKKQITIGNTYFYRDIISPEFLLTSIRNIDRDMMVGSGRLTFVNDFIRDLYKNNGLKYENYVYENFDEYNEYKNNNEYYLKSNKCLYSYADLLNFTLNDIERARKIK